MKKIKFLAKRMLCVFVVFLLMNSLAYGQETGNEKAKKNYQVAKTNFEADPNEENTIWLGRRTAYLGKYKEAIDFYTKSLKKFPDSYKLYRHRGHRYISTRQFDKAIADFKKAAELVKGKLLEIEPDGIPNAANIPLSNTQFNIWYHLGLAYYLSSDFEQAVSAYMECMKWSKNDDLLVATVDWLYMTYRRINNIEAAEKLLTLIKKDMKILENDSYYKRLLMYKGLKSPESLLVVEKGNESIPGINLATQGYGVANWYYYNGNKKKAKEVFEKVLNSSNRFAFGYIAAEVDVKNMLKK